MEESKSKSPATATRYVTTVLEEVTTGNGYAERERYVTAVLEEIIAHPELADTLMGALFIVPRNRGIVGILSNLALAGVALSCCNELYVRETREFEDSHP